MSILHIFQFLFALGLIITILLHQPKGEGFGSIGGGAKLFNTPKGLEAGLDRLTMILATGFIILSLLIAIIS